MSGPVELVLPAIDRPETFLDTAAGRLRVAGQHIADRRIPVDPDEIAQLVAAARAAARHAHAPYSAFHVGAAVIMADDPDRTLFTGANVENSSYGATTCGERSALHQAVSRGFRRLQFLAVSTADALDRPLAERSPCGICRQVIKEFADAGLDTSASLILVDSGEDDVLCDVFDIDRLLPHGFDFSK